MQPIVKMVIQNLVEKETFVLIEICTRIIHLGNILKVFSKVISSIDCDSMNLKKLSVIFIFNIYSQKIIHILNLLT